MFGLPLNDPESFGEQNPADWSDGRSDASAPDINFDMVSPPDNTEGDWTGVSVGYPSCLTPIGEQAPNPMAVPTDTGREDNPEPVVSTTPEVIPGLSFIVPHDGSQAEVTSDEQVLVARGFTSLVSDLLLSHIDKVHHTKAIGSESWLQLKLPVSGDSHWAIGVRVCEPLVGDGEQSEPLSEGISLQRVEKGLGREGAEYYKDQDGIVQRNTFGDVATRVAEQDEYLTDITPTEDMNPAEALHILEGLLRSAVNAAENQRLAKDMGYNNQPVGMQELNSLVDFISQPGVVPDKA